MKPYFRFKTLILFCLGLFSFDTLIKAQSNGHIHLMVFELPIDSAKIVFDANYSNSVDVSSGDTLNVTGYSKGEIVTRNYINIPFVVKADSSVIQVIRITNEQLASLPQDGINSWERLQKGYNLEIDYDEFGTQVSLNGKVIPKGVRTITADAGETTVHLFSSSGKSVEYQMNIQDRVVQDISAKIYLSNTEFRKSLINPGSAFVRTNEQSKGNFHRRSILISGSILSFFLVQNQLWAIKNRADVRSISNSKTLQTAELSHSMVKITGVGSILSLVGFSAIYGNYIYQARKQTLYRDKSAATLSMGVNSIQLSIDF